MTKFQRSIDKELLKDIVRVFHPSLSNEQIDLLKYSVKYNWVTIGFRVKNYGYISIGICNHEVSGSYLAGPISKELVKELFKEKRIGYRIWRFADDYLFTSEIPNIIQNDEQRFKERIPIPSCKEFYNYYMED